MKKTFIFLMMCLLGGINSVMAQETVTIGDGQKDSQYVPFNANADGSISQTYYLKSEIGEANKGKTITAISYKQKSGKSPFSHEIEIYMVNTESTNAGGVTMAKLNSSDLVYSGEVEFRIDEWVSITLDTPFSYTGDNILVCVNDKYIESYASPAPKFYCYSTDAYKTLYKSNTSYTTYDPTTSAITASNSVYTPCVQFTFSGPSTPTPPTVTLNTPENGATGIFNPSLSFTLGNAKQYQIQKAEGTGAFVIVQDWTEGNGNISYQTNLLKSNTTYSWKVVAKNDDGETTSEVYTFTTKEFAAPGELTNVSPENNAQDLINPKLEWTFGENTEQQQLLIDGVVKVDWTNIGTKISDSYQTSGLTAGSHTWQVNTRNGEGTTTGTEYSFTVASLPDNVTPIFPANGATNVSSKTIKWQFADNTTEYRFLYGEAEDQLAYCGHGTQYEWLEVTTNEVELEAPYFESGKTYYWAVDVQNSIGKRTVYQGGDPVSIFSFTTASVLNTTYKSPENGATNIANPILSWNYNGTPDYYQVLMGTAENELVAKTEWLAAEGTGGTFQTENLNNATQYYWQVNIKNGETVMEGEIWSFVTTLPAPTNVAANPVQIVPTLSMTYGSTTISWDDMGSAGYNVYLGTTKLNAELITATSYEIAANTMKLSYNMNPGYDIYVQAVYAIGESNMSEAVNVKVTGFGYFESTIYSNDWYTRLAGATVTLTCTSDEFGNEYDGNGSVYTFTTNSNGEVFETIEMPNGETVTNTSLKLYNGTYSVLVEKEYYNSLEGNITISNKQTTEFDKILNPDNTYIFTVTPYKATFESIDVYIDASVGHYHVYLKEGETIEDLGMQYFVEDNSVAYFKYAGWANLVNGDYQFGVAKVEDCINWSDIVTRDYNIFETDGNLSDANNWRDGLPGDGEDIYINANAVVEAGENLAFGDVTINDSLTINGSLTAVNVINSDINKLVMNEGAQLYQGNTKLSGQFIMTISNPTDWSESDITKVDGWQFIASPFTNSSISNFTNHSGEYDLYKFDGGADMEWINHKQGDSGEDEEDDGYDNIIHGKQGGTESFETEFVNGYGYLASYEKVDENQTKATFSGTFNSAQSHSWNLSYNAEKPLANFHLLGNPFTFDMEWNKVAQTNMVEGYAVLNGNGSGYQYMTEGTIKVGDAFFVKTTADDATLSYNHYVKTTRNEEANSLNIIATSAEGRDNLIISLSSEKAGFNKLQNFDDAIATVYVHGEGVNYGIYNCNDDVQEVEVNFNANKMGSYTISIEPNGKFQTVTLVDRFTGIETNMLLEDYHFTAMSSENNNRFIVKMKVNGQQTTDNSHFAYVSGEELIIEAEGAVEIIDMMGRVVYSNDVENTNNRINVANLENAAYIVRVINEEGIKTQKVVIY